MSEWRDTTLGEFVALQRGHDLTDPQRRTGRVPVMGSAGQNGFHDTALANGPGIVIGRSGASFGQIHFSLVDYWPHNTALYVTDFKGNDERFAFYFLKAIDFSGYNSGSAQPSLNRNFIYPIPIRIPPLPEQKSIAAVLGALDDKIECNRRMNATLEAMARALFQSWFVDFDPVRRNVESGMRNAESPAPRIPKSAIDDPQFPSALFPAQFQDSELGEIPQGWDVGNVGDLARFSRDTLNPADFPDEIFDHYSLPAFDDGRTPKQELGAAIKSNKFIVPPNAVLLSKLNPHIPRIWAPALSESRRAICSTEFLVAAPTSAASNALLFCLFTSNSFARVYGTLVTGTTGSHQRIKAESVLATKIVIPPSSLVRRFTTAVRPILQSINHNTEQSRTLATLRDALLPKLLSGDLQLDQHPPL